MEIRVKLSKFQTWKKKNPKENQTVSILSSESHAVNISDFAPFTKITNKSTISSYKEMPKKKTPK